MAMGDSKSLGKVGIKAIVFYLATTALAITLALGVANLINPGIGLDISSFEMTEQTTAAESLSFADTLLNIIPKNPIEAMANGDMLQEPLIFALFVGVLLAKRGEKADAVAQFISQFNDLMMDMTMAVMKVAPVGVFCLIREDVLRNRRGRFRLSAEVYGMRMIAPPAPVPWRLPDSAVSVYQAESDAVCEKIPSGHGIRLFHCNFQRDDPNVHRDTRSRRWVSPGKSHRLPFLWELPLIWTEQRSCRALP